MRDRKPEEREVLLAGLKDFAPAVPEAGTRSDARSSSKGSNRCQDHTMPRAYWKGYLRLSLVTCPIELFPATSQAEKTHFHQTLLRQLQLEDCACPAT